MVSARSPRPFGVLGLAQEIAWGAASDAWRLVLGTMGALQRALELSVCAYLHLVVVRTSRQLLVTALRGCVS